MNYDQNSNFHWEGNNTISPGRPKKILELTTFSANFQMPKLLAGKVLPDSHVTANTKFINKEMAKSVADLYSVMIGDEMVLTPLSKPELSRP